jgi:hypothetical protein
MSWSVSGRVIASARDGEVQALNPTGQIGEGAKKQLEVAKECALDLLENLDGHEFNVQLSGHSQADAPGSALDSISISISAIS